MKLFFGEFLANYDQYHFPYQVLLTREEGDNISKIYEMGFLPFRSIKNLYYLCRSVRVDLSKFELSSENQRILRKTKDFKCCIQRLSSICYPEFSSGSKSLKIPNQVRNDTAFNYTSLVQKSCKDWFNKKFGVGKISAAAIRKIFTAGIFTHVFVWSSRLGSNNSALGYAIAFINEDLLHYAHVFYNPEFSKANLGARMMLEMIIWAKKSEKKYAYLGTCYSRPALYKTQYAGLEFFNGYCWSDDLDELKYLIKRKSEDYLFQDREYLAKFSGEKGIEGTIGEKKGIRINS